MKGKKEKKDYDQNIGLHEVFLESVPTSLIITCIFVRAYFGKNILVIFVTVSGVDCHHSQLGVNLITLLQGMVVGVWGKSSSVRPPLSKHVARTLVPLNSS